MSAVGLEAVRDEKPTATAQMTPVASSVKPRPLRIVAALGFAEPEANAKVPMTSTA